LLPENYTAQVNVIDQTHKSDVNQCKWELLTEYFKVGDVSWNKVIDALEKSRHHNIAEKIKSDIFKYS